MGIGSMPITLLNEKLQQIYLKATNEYPENSSRIPTILQFNINFQNAIESIPVETPVEVKRIVVKKLCNKAIEEIKELSHNEATVLTNSVDASS